MPADGERAWTHRAATRDDFPALCQVFAECFGHDRDPDFFAWKYHRNPHGPGILRLAEGDGEVVGFLGSIPRRIVVAGVETVLHHPGDAMTLSGWRGQGIMTELFRSIFRDAAAANVTLLIGFEGRQSHKGARTAGWEEVARIREWILPLRTVHRLPRLEHRMPEAAAALGTLTDRLAQPRLRRRLDRSASPLVPVDRFTTDDAALAHGSDAPVSLVRDEAWLNWRYRDTPSGALQSSRSAAGDGFVVAEYGPRFAYVHDCAGVSTSTQKGLLAAVASQALERGCRALHAVSMPGSPIDRVYQAAGFHPVADESRLLPLVLRFTAEGHDRTTLMEPRAWHISHGDRDVETLATTSS